LIQAIHVENLIMPTSRTSVSRRVANLYYDPTKRRNEPPRNISASGPHFDKDLTLMKVTALLGMLLAAVQTWEVATAQRWLSEPPPTPGEPPPTLFRSPTT
jgi:hypothetical protein